MAVTFPPAAKADILRRLAGAIAASDNAINVPLVGRTIEELADEYGVLNGEVKDVAQKHGWPRPDSMKRAAELLCNPQTAARPTHPAPLVPDAMPGTPVALAVTGHYTYGQLLAQAAKSSKARTRGLGTKIAGLVADLAQLVADEEEAVRRGAEIARAKAEARAEVERLERELAEAKARLTGKKPATPKPAGGTPDGVRASGPVPSAAEIRAWAAANDVECPPRGIVPNAVRAAYDEQAATS